MSAPNAPLTPKEFAAVAYGGSKSARWVRGQCALFLTSHGKSGIAVLGGCQPRCAYYIPQSELERVQSTKTFTE